MSEIKMIQTAPFEYKAIYEGVKVANVHYTLGVKFCYRIEYVDGKTGYATNMELVETFISIKARKMTEPK